MKKLEHYFVTLNGWLLIAMMAGMTLVVGANIALRYSTGHSLPWADETARYLMIWMPFEWVEPVGCLELCWGAPPPPSPA